MSTLKLCTSAALVATVAWSSPALSGGLLGGGLSAGAGAEIGGGGLSAGAGASVGGIGAEAGLNIGGGGLDAGIGADVGRLGADARVGVGTSGSDTAAGHPKSAAVAACASLGAGAGDDCSATASRRSKASANSPAGPRGSGGPDDRGGNTAGMPRIPDEMLGAGTAEASLLGLPVYGKEGTLIGRVAEAEVDRSRTIGSLRVLTLKGERMRVINGISTVHPRGIWLRLDAETFARYDGGRSRTIRVN